MIKPFRQRSKLTTDDYKLIEVFVPPFLISQTNKLKQFKPLEFLPILLKKYIYKKKTSISSTVSHFLTTKQNHNSKQNIKNKQIDKGLFGDVF